MSTADEATIARPLLDAPPTEAVPGVAQLPHYFLALHRRGEDVPNVFAAVRLRGELDRSALRSSLDAIVRRHEVLRASFDAEEASYEPRPVGECPFRVVRLDRPDLPPEGCEALAHAALEAEVRRPFGVDDPPLVRALLLVLGHADHVLVITASHLVFDGWSVGVLFRELGRLYKCLAKGLKPARLATPKQYRDFVRWEQRSHRAGRRFWERRLRDLAHRVVLPGERETGDVRMAVHRFRIDDRLVDAARDFAQASSTTLFVLVAAAWISTLAPAAEEEVVVATLFSGRTTARHSAMIGCLARSVFLRVRVGDAPSFPELLGRVRLAVVEALAHQFYPYLGDDLVPSPARLRFDSWHDPLELYGLECTPFGTELELVHDVPLEHGLDRNPPELVFLELAEHVEARIVHNAAKFDDTTIGAVGRRFVAILERVAAAER